MWANDYDSRLRSQLMVNLAGQQNISKALTEDGGTEQHLTVSLQADLASQAHSLQEAAQVVTEEGLKRPVWQWQVQPQSGIHDNSNQGTSSNQGSQSCTVRVSCMDARRLLAGAFLAEQTFDVIDIDR